MRKGGKGAQFHTRESLHQAVWEKPLTTVARSVGMSDVALGKLCKRHKIPLPGRGYWAKKKAGVDLQVDPLPRHYDRLKLKILDEDLLREKDRLEGLASETLAGMTLCDNKEERKLNPKLRGVKSHLCRRGGTVDRKGLPENSRDAYGLQVTKRARSRAIELLNQLLMQAELLGWSARVDCCDGLVVTALDVDIQIEVSEHVARQPHRKTTAERRAQRRQFERWSSDDVEFVVVPEFDYIPSGELKVSAKAVDFYSTVSWRDTTKRQVEHRIGEIFKGLVLLAVSNGLRRYEKDRQRIRYENDERVYEQYSDRLEKEQDELSKLKKDANNYAEAVRIREYLDAIEGHYPGKEAIPLDVLEWLDWARQKANWIDPRFQFSDIVLDAPALDKPSRW